MAAAPSYFDRKPPSSNRPGLSHLQQDPSSPLTPQRNFSSTFSSPSISYRNEEESFVFELGSRHLSAGIAGETRPRCTLSFGPEDSRRVGDYRRWLPEYKKVIRTQRESEWSQDYELWRMDLREVDLGLVEDKIERAVREAHIKYFLMDQKPRRLVLVLPSIMPHQLLSSVLSSIFLNFQFPSITLFSTPILHTIAAGCRSSLVVDIGWAETVLTAVYEYREVKQTRTTRATKSILLQMVRMLARQDEPAMKILAEGYYEALVQADFDVVEDVTARMAWCPKKKAEPGASNIQDRPTRVRKGRKKRMEPILEEDAVGDAENDVGTEAQNADSSQEQMDTEDPIIAIPSPFTPGKTLDVPFSYFALPVETALLADGKPTRQLDDHEQAVHLLMFKTLLGLPTDVRSLCMSRIIITGGGSNIPGLKTRLLDEVSALVEERGWGGVEGEAADKRRQRLKEISHNLQKREGVENWPKKESKASLEDSSRAELVPSAASLQEQIHDEITRKLERDRIKGSKPAVSAVIRGVESLGAWAGGSLLAGLKVKGVVDIERDAFLQHGLAGARKEADSSGTQHRQSVGPNIARGGIQERSGWTLGAWA
ncbi:MAG: hypothetical protein Q9191_001399 [Dirinaria sp. TL-2023a]